MTDQYWMVGVDGLRRIICLGGVRWLVCKGWASWVGSREGLGASFAL